MVHGLEGKFGVVPDPSGAQEVCVPAVDAVKQTVCCCELTPCSEVGSGGDSCEVLWKLTHVPVEIHVFKLG